MDVIADLPADAQTPEPVQQGEGLFHDPAMNTQARAVRSAAARDDRLDGPVAKPAPVAVVVIGAVGVQPARFSAGAADLAADRRDRLDQRDELQDVVAVAAAKADRERDAVPVADHVVLGVGPASIDRARTGFGLPLAGPGLGTKSQTVDRPPP